MSCVTYHLSLTIMAVTATDLPPITHSRLVHSRISLGPKKTPTQKKYKTLHSYTHDTHTALQPCGHPPVRGLDLCYSLNAHQCKLSIKNDMGPFFFYMLKYKLVYIYIFS